MTTMAHTMQSMRDAIKSDDTLMSEGSITEYLPAYAELTYRFNDGLTVRIADHGNGKFQATLDGFFALEPVSADALVEYLANLD